MTIFLRLILAMAALAMAAYCARRAVTTWTMSLATDTSSKRFFAIYFRWLWGSLRAFWAADWLVIAIGVLFRPPWAWLAALGFPMSFAVALIVSWTYMPWAHRRYVSRSA